MARDENPPFPLGQTWHNGGTIDSNNLQDTHLEGQEWVFDDVDISQSSGAKPHRTPFKRRMRIVRNASGVALLGKRAVTYQSTNVGKRVDGYCDVTNEHIAGITDDFLPSAGCPANDMCWITVEGPTLVVTDLSNGINNSFSRDDPLGALTAAASTQSTTASPGGRIGAITATALTATSTGTTDGTLSNALFNALFNAVGRALSARTTNQTNTDTLMYVNGGRI